MSDTKIPKEIKVQVEAIVAEFNRTVIDNPDCYYVIRYKGKFLYMDRYGFGSAGPVCRLEYTGSIETWNFAIYKYSTGEYDPNEWLFPGYEYVDGTIVGAMRAGLMAYS